MSEPIDLLLDGTMNDIAIIIEGVRLSPADQSARAFEDLQRVFHRLCKLRDEISARRNWEMEVVQHLAELPKRPRSVG